MFNLNKAVDTLTDEKRAEIRDKIGRLRISGQPDAPAIFQRRPESELLGEGHGLLALIKDADALQAMHAGRLAAIDGDALLSPEGKALKKKGLRAAHESELGALKARAANLKPATRAPVAPANVEPTQQQIALAMRWSQLPAQEQQRIRPYLTTTERATGEAIAACDPALSGATPGLREGLRQRFDAGAQPVVQEDPKQAAERHAFDAASNVLSQIESALP
jgi:hypothetical protein